MNQQPQFAWRLAGWGILVFALFAFAPVIHAQGCALCYNDAAATGSQGQRALRHAILVLLIPPLTFFAGILGLLYQRRNSTR